ncbi:uncharacterized protein LOC100824956 isoform X2 [Brachypodium distachyon]|uniref:uncharacterized protein LOC100824956 isoform X2 n=1 Tax=Brachypodium distachyon TaxID=15368 RepID=UPI000D0D4CEF|nr:uncharacterized protein LOC100824956 isoform X2 [Brachypodium distachyon]|eukprot:XP_024312908.1 uncharacterized protein LOC100824956 isoform X2 [Brachypodium distachyon]
MAGPTLPSPSLSAFTPVKKEHEADVAAAAAAHAPRPPPHEKRHHDRLPITPTQQILTPQTTPSGSLRTDSFTVKRGGEPALTPKTVPTSIKRDPDADAESGNHAEWKNLRTPPHKKRRGDLSLVASTQPLFSPTTSQSDNSRAQSFTVQRDGELDLTPKIASTIIKCEPDVDAGKDSVGKVVRRRHPDPHSRPKVAHAPTLWVNRGRLGHLLHDLARAHKWHDAAGVFSALLPGILQPDSFGEAHRIFVDAMEIHRRLAEDSGIQLGGRSSCSTPWIFGKTMGGPFVGQCELKKHLVKLELAMFHLSQGKIGDAYNLTKSLIAMDGLQTEPTLNLIHGLISYDKWYSGLPKDMQLEGFDIYNEACTISVESNGFGENRLQDSSNDNCSIDVDDASLPSCSSQSSINIENIDKKWKISKKPGFLHPVKENDSVGSQVNEEVVDTDFRSVFFNTSDSPTCGLEKSLLPLRLKCAPDTSNDSFDSYWKYKSTTNSCYEEAVKCLRLALHSSPPVMSALLPLIQILLLGDKLKDALVELEETCRSSTTALPFRLRGRLLEYFDQNQVSTISCCYEEALRRDPTCGHSVERLIEMHRKGYYNSVQLLEAIALHLDSVNGKPFIWEELVSCFLRLFSHRTADYEDCISCNIQGDTAIAAFSSMSSVFFEQHKRESWKLRCRWWMNHHFSQSIYTSETLKGDCKLLASKAACATHLFGPRFKYVGAVNNYLFEQKAKDELQFLSRNMGNSVKLLQSLEKLTP